MAQRICSIDGCERKHYARGWCNSHYHSYRRYGDPLRATPIPVIVPRGLPLDQRFLAWLAEDPSGCLLWTGRRNRLSDDRCYGIIAVKKDGKWGNIYAHRYAWERVNGPILEGFEIDHTCHNTLCVLVSHLQMVTHQQNMENRKGAQRSSRTGIRGVHLYDWGRWGVCVTLHGKRHYGGYYDTKEDAETAVVELRHQLMTNNLADAPS